MNAESKGKPKLCAVLDRIIHGIGEVTSWLSILLIGAIIIQVVLRYIFGMGLVILEELQWHFYGIMLMIGASYAFISDSHIRLDILHSRFSARNKEKVEIFGIVFLLIPMIVVIFSHSLDFLSDSWRVNERSDAPMGLCCLWAFKAFIPIGMGLLGAAALSRLVRAIVFLFQARAESE